MLHVAIDVRRDPELLTAAAESLAAMNFVMLARSHGNVPRLYESGVVYRREHGTEEWRTIDEVYEDGYGDCEDLAGIRAAELRYYEGEPARVLVVETPRGSYHAVVLRADNSIEDPSRILLMLESRRGLRSA